MLTNFEPRVFDLLPSMRANSDASFSFLVSNPPAVLRFDLDFCQSCTQILMAECLMADSNLV
ncbi:unnamed protein product [Hymenolepis diminuta]|uniref:Uncharacterized protein n=1 Tax=Hymenolepis diminuta TaxID=6216 RepID=A0A564XXB1_HYMDI|nr:unnamed protein product [Hymenolepis diminuta]VUZ39527.1 unnamed protein product [Hymenolepis diminuta]VUZ47434.1 unnamed protein product [Hymenolepis diminuta]